MSKRFSIHTLFLALISGGAALAQTSVSITVKNSLDFERSEVISLARKDIAKILQGNAQADIRIQNTATGQTEVLQWLDTDGDGQDDELLFKPVVPAKGAATYKVFASKEVQQPEPQYTTYSRFVPERTDDYTWENDKIAFRTYGPDAQQRTEQHRENGTLSSGIDLWLKRTSESIINKWYKGYLTDPLYYHKDRGEGYDPYHVGGSRGTGGTGIWENDSLLVSKNFVTYKTIATGPLRTVFELTYAPYSPYQVTEIKRISLDLGSNFSKFEVTYSGIKPVPNYAVGITLHEKKGTTVIDKKKGYFIHNEAIDSIYIGEALVMEPKIVNDAFARKTGAQDQSNLIVVTKPKSPLTYYAGFAWQKSGQVQDAAGWETLVKRKAEALKSPLKVSIK